MKSTPPWMRTAVIPLVILAVACSDSTSPERPRIRPPTSATPVAGVQPEIDVVARELAVALRDPQFRRAFHGAMTASRRSERRVLLREIVRLPGAGLLFSRLKEAQGRGIRLDLDSCDEEMMMCPDDGEGGGGGGDDGCGVSMQCAEEEECYAQCADQGDTPREFPHEPPPIEAYMPADENGDTWTGSSTDVLTLPQPDDEAAPTVIAYDYNGNYVELQGGDSAPVVPVIAVGYAEASLDPEPVPVPPTKTFRRGVGVKEYITTMRAENSHEPWWKGRPEFELYFAGAKDGGLEYKREMHIPGRTWSKKGSRNRSWRGTPLALPLETWDTTLGSRIKVECIEHDGSPIGAELKVGGTTKKMIDSVGVDVAFNITFEIDKADDKCGSSYITLMLTNGGWDRIPSGPDDYDGTGTLFWYGYGMTQ